MINKAVAQIKRKAVARIRKKNQITVPTDVLQELGVDVGDSLLFKLNFGHWTLCEL